MIVELLFLAQIYVVFNKSGLLADVLPAVLTSLTNEDRAKNNAAPLEQNELLNKAAQLKAEDMASRGYFSHTTPEGNLPWYFLDKVGYKYSFAGENLAINFFDSEDVARAWMNSPTHRANVIKKDFTEIGIGVASGTYQGKNTIFVAEFFGTPLAAAPIAQYVKTAPKNIEAPVEEKPSSTKVLGEVTTKQVAEEASQNTGSNSSVKLAAQKIATSPRDYVNYVYTISAILFFLTLLVFIVKSEIKHPSIVLRGAAFIVIVFTILFINTHALGLQTKVSASGVGSSVFAN